MPKGAHFKKDNPRIIQVSFKVNATEHEKIKSMAAKQKLSIPEWMRMKLINDEEVSSKITAPTVQVEKVKIEKPKIEKAKVEKVQVVKESNSKEEGKLPPNQMSLF